VATQLQGIAEVARVEPRTVEKAARADAKGPDFGDALVKALGDASGAERAADEAAKKFAAGAPDVGIHEVMIAAEKASIAVRYAVTLKNKVIDAYRELMNTPL
jgi:flagellar hook-basal body complex protein FliE